MAAQAEDIVLYDIPSRDPLSTWSLNPWKTRLALNFKGVPYTTTWLEYPDIEPTLKGLGVPPHPEERGNTKPYTCPALKLGDTILMDSIPIAQAIEAKYPEPSMHLDAPEVEEAREKLGTVLSPLRGVWMPDVPLKVLSPRSAEYFSRTRAEMFGLPLDEYAQKHGGEEAWAAAEENIKVLAALVKRKGGPYILGKEASYADFYVVSALHFLRRLDQGYYDRIVAIGPALGALVDACAKWLERGSY